jgi:hypothetical protein
MKNHWILAVTIIAILGAVSVVVMRSQAPVEATPVHAIEKRRSDEKRVLSERVLSDCEGGHFYALSEDDSDVSPVPRKSLSNPNK